MGRSLNIFVSYASEDSTEVGKLVEWLRSKGYDPWIDKAKLLPGQAWKAEIEQAVDRSDIILVCLSQRSVGKTGYVQKELRMVLDAADLRPAGHIFVIPVRLDDECPLPDPRLRELHRLNLFEPNSYDLLENALIFVAKKQAADEALRERIKETTLDFETKNTAVQERLDAAEILVAESQGETIAQIDEFIQNVGLNDVERVMVTTHTGGVTLKGVIDALKRAVISPAPSKPIEVHVLLRSPHLSDLGRARAIQKSLSQLREFATGTNNFDVEARFYASPPLLRCIMATHRGGRHSAYLSFYDWSAKAAFNLRSKANKSSFAGIRMDEDHSDRWLFEMFLSWFAHLWGVHRIHTLLFDFDDTLFLTTECQVRGWMEALKTAVDGKTFAPSELASDVRKILERRVDLTPLITNIFLDKQEEQEILGRLFNKLPVLSKLDLLRGHRWKVREELTAQNAIPISCIIQDIQALRAQYQLAIVSATSEALVRQVLVRHGLEDLFPYIVGRDAPRQNWQSVESKTEQFLRISNMTGVPLERMIFVGDSNADYRSASQLGLHFVENRYNAMRHGRISLIKSLDPERRPFLTGKLGELPSVIQSIEARVARLP